jgi:hypothetical protein
MADKQAMQATTDATQLARVSYVVVGDCIRHTLDVIARLQDSATGTPLFLALEAMRREISAVQAGAGMSGLATESLKGRM